MRIENLQNENRKYAKSIGNFHVLEYVQDAEAKIPEKTYKWLTFLYVNRYRKCVIPIGQSQ